MTDDNQDPDYNTPLAVAEREAKHRQAIAEANAYAAAAQQKQIASYIPSLSNVVSGKVGSSGDQALFASALAHRALSTVAATVAETVLHHARQAENVMRAEETVRKDATDVASRSNILVTSDEALANSDALYVDVDVALDQLIAIAAQLAADEPNHDVNRKIGVPQLGPSLRAAMEVGDQVPPKGGMELAEANTTAVTTIAGALAGGPLGAVAGAIAGAVPAALTALATNRTVSTFSATVDDIAATSAVCGALVAPAESPLTVFHDNFRLLPAGALRTKLTSLQESRRALISKKIELEDTKAVDQGKPDRLIELTEATVRAALIDTLIGIVDTFAASLTMVPDGAKRSLLASAALREQLHGNSDNNIRYVLLIKVASGSSSQVVDDRPLMLADKFATVTSLSLTYLMIDTRDSHIVCGGTEGGSAAIHGSIGSTFSVHIMKQEDDLGGTAPAEHRWGR